MGNKYTRFTTTTRKPVVANDLSVIILASSMGYRMKSYGPKSLIQLSTGESLLENQLKNIKMVYPTAEIILTVGFEADKIIKKRPVGVKIIENQYYDLTNNVEEIRLALNATFSENIIIINGNLLFNQECISGITALNCSAITVNPHDSEEEIGLTIVNDRITIMSHGISPKWCNIAYFTGKEFKFLKSIISDRDKNKLYLFEVINMILDRRGSFKPYYNEAIKIKQIESSKDIK